MEAARNDTNILIFDTCRGSFAGKAFDEVEKGFVAMKGPQGSAIVFSTALGQTAFGDAETRNSVYTRHFVRALREDQDAAAALGVNTTRYKVLVFVVTSMMAAAAGAVMAHYIRIITPNNLMILQMSLVVAMAVIGGVENIVAAAIGAILIEFLLELLRNSFEIGPVTVDMTIWRFVVFGVLLMLTLRFSRNGLSWRRISAIMCGRNTVRQGRRESMSKL